MIKINLNIFKKKKVFKKGGLHTNPDVYWNILQALAFLLIALSLVFGYYIFKMIDKEFIVLNTNPDGETKSISKDRIEGALQYFSEKAKKSKEILSSPSPVIDPSR